MQELEATWGRALCVWWLMLWRGVLGAFVLSFVTSFIVSFIYTFIARALGSAQQGGGVIAGTIVGTIAGAIWGIAVMRMALKKNYSEFRIVLVPHSTVQQADLGLQRIEPRF